MHCPFLAALAALLIFAGPIQAHVIGGAIVRQSGNGSFQIQVEMRQCECCLGQHRRIIGLQS